jgi:hypothetical protein
MSVDECDGSQENAGALDDLAAVRFVDLAREQQRSPLPVPLATASNLPLAELDPEVFERLMAEIVKCRPSLGAHFCGRRGQNQYGLDIVELDSGWPPVFARCAAIRAFWLTY